MFDREHFFERPRPFVRHTDMASSPSAGLSDILFGLLSDSFAAPDPRQYEKDPQRCYPDMD